LHLRYPSECCHEGVELCDWNADLPHSLARIAVAAAEARLGNIAAIGPYFVQQLFCGLPDIQTISTVAV
jgi:hypothetical protein